jgi:hypothetical protein
MHEEEHAMAAQRGLSRYRRGDDRLAGTRRRDAQDLVPLERHLALVALDEVGLVVAEVWRSHQSDRGNFKTLVSKYLQDGLAPMPPRCTIPSSNLAAFRQALRFVRTGITLPLREEAGGLR